MKENDRKEKKWKEREKERKGKRKGNLFDVWYEKKLKKIKKKN